MVFVLQRRKDYQHDVIYRRNVRFFFCFAVFGSFLGTWQEGKSEEAYGCSFVSISEQSFGLLRSVSSERSV